MNATDKKVIRRPLPCSCNVGESCELCIAFRAERKQQRQADKLAKQIERARAKAEERSKRPQRAVTRPATTTARTPTAFVPRPVVVAAPRGKPGTKMTRLLEAIGLTPVEGCNCGKIAAWMDNLGVDGCRKNFDRIVEKMRENQKKYGAWDTAKAAMGAVAIGLALKLDWRDPIPGLVTEAIRLAEEDEAKEKTPAEKSR